MFAMSRSLRLLVASIVGLASAAVLAFAAFSSAASADHTWENYHWGRTNPFTLQLDDNMSDTSYGKWDEYLYNDASPDWSQSSVLNTTVNSSAPQDPKKCRASAGRVEVCNARYGFNGWLGIAQIWISGGHITQGITKMNDSYFNTSRYNTPAWRKLVLCQEIGHTFGLDHQDENFDNANLGTCMDYSGNPAGPPTNEQPNSHDYDQLDGTNGVNPGIYTHTDTTNTVGTTAAASKLPAEMVQHDFPTRDTWGRLVKASRDGKLLVYKRDFGRGNLLVTFVRRPI